MFFALSHTFDENTLLALETESDIRIVSDTVANDVYCRNGFTFVPQQTGRVRKLPFQTVTCCYQPNMMNDYDFEYLEAFVNQYRNCFVDFPIEVSRRKKGFLIRS